MIEFKKKKATHHFTEKKLAISRQILVRYLFIQCDFCFKFTIISIMGIVVTFFLFRICLCYSHVLKKLFEEYWDLEIKILMSLYVDGNLYSLPEMVFRTRKKPKV